MKGIQRFPKTLQSIVLAGVVLAGTLGTAITVAAQEFSDLKSNGNLHLRGYGSFFVKGNTLAVNNAAQTGGYNWFGGIGTGGGVTLINQMYVQFMLPLAQQGKKHNPIVFVHGGQLTSKSWQTTPDGRMGWDEYFVRQGFDTYLADQVSRGRSGFDATKYNLVRSGQDPNVLDLPPIFIGSDIVNWNGFRWGATPCTVSPCYATTTPHPDVRFPMYTAGVGNAGSNLMAFAISVPDMNATMSTVFPPSGFLEPTDPSAFYNTPVAMAQLAKELGGAILVGHSESGGWPTRAALQPASGCYPWTSASACKVKGIMQIEVGCFSNLTPAEIDTLKHIPIIVMIGDFFPPAIPALCNTEINQITAAGGDIKLAWLPQLTPGSLFPGSPGPIFGNDHMMMLDNNNQQIAQILVDWATSRGL
jgi:pimeloyl-ACP methyl ester carboxylesterase